MCHVALHAITFKLGKGQIPERRLARITTVASKRHRLALQAQFFFDLLYAFERFSEPVDPGNLSLCFLKRNRGRAELGASGSALGDAALRPNRRPAAELSLVTRAWVLSSQYLNPGAIPLRALGAHPMTLNAGSTETHCCESLPIDHTVGRHIVVTFVSANCPSRLRPQDPIDGTMVVPGASKSTLHLYNCVCVVISVIVVTVVIVRVIPIIGIRIEERETKRVEENERSIVETAEAIVTIIVAIVPKPTCARHGPWRKARRRSRDGGSRHHSCGVWGRRCKGCS